MDTLFEIGGQDAKYTYLVNGVPSDYAMNEACSAGTGSFLEESAHETLGAEDGGDRRGRPSGGDAANFNDQCAAFIASDIKTVIQEGMDRDQIAAGLVYSICMNYTNRVKGNRPVGEKDLHAGRRVLQRRRAPGHGGLDRQAHRRPRRNRASWAPSAWPWRSEKRIFCGHDA